MRNIFIKSSLIIISTLSLYSCSSLKKEKKQAEETVTLNGVWELASISSVANIDKEFPDKLPNLLFDNKEGLIGFGNDGCNQYRANFSIKKNNTLEVSSEVSNTRMFCDKVNSALYLKNLSEANSFEISENILKLNTPTDTLKFYKVSLEGKWVLDKLNTVKAKVNDLYPYKKPFINININSNQITGNTACNSITANFLIFENKMSFKHIISTKMFCEGSGEKDFTDALGKVKKYEIKGTRLILSNDKKVIMEFKRDYE